MEFELDDELEDNAQSQEELSDSSDEADDEADDDVAVSLGYVGDRGRKWLPPHNVSSTGPRVVWSRGSAPCRAADFLFYFSLLI